MTFSPDARRVDVDPTTLRRAPRLGRFVLAGILLGALVALLASLVPGGVDRSDIFWLVFLTTGLFGGILGALVHWLLDRRSLRRDAATRR